MLKMSGKSSGDKGESSGDKGKSSGDKGESCGEKGDVNFSSSSNTSTDLASVEKPD